MVVSPPCPVVSFGPPSHRACSFIVLRYAGILATFPSLFFTSMQIKGCQTAMAVSQLGTVLVVASSGIIFGYRVSAIWGGNRVVHLVIGFMYLFMISSWVRILLAVSS